MVNKFLNTILFGNKIQSVQIHFNQNEKEFRLLEIQKNKNDVSIIERYVTKDYDQLISTLSKNKPVILSVTGQGVISKKVNSDPNYQSKILFNNDPNDFYWYEFHQEETIYVSVARKELIDKEIEEFKKSQISILNLSLGPFVGVGIQQLLENTVLQVGDTELSFKENQLIGYKKNTDYEIKDYNIGDEKISSENIIPFANLINYLYPNDDIISDTEFLSTEREDFTYKKAFNIVGAFTLSFFLLTLLVSYLLLGHYQQEHHKLQVQLGEQNVAYNKLVSLEKDKENKEAILKESGLIDSNFLSFYISEITKEVPSEVNLQTLNVFPTTSKIKAEQRINFINNQVNIEGTVSSNSAFANWVKELKKQSWVDNVKIIDFQRENRTNSFKIKLILKFDV
ncbi:PilN domain-containing protein [Aquimarina sp. 2201CG5-10]|uniref:PilN domain-containing protein n=1 Tax=Aquimarina callyspongiae TaxID=3098150 RepID=UPI002AB5C05C|nr:PilN domain-containing protein [Aquimarina sp. 2201CG5-10]MDY8138472.1 PilN domain-containing protein [Aquimarina sp. 2201CG5-10]